MGYKTKLKDCFDEPFLAYIQLTSRGTTHSESGNFHFKCT